MAKPHWLQQGVLFREHFCLLSLQAKLYLCNLWNSQYFPLPHQQLLASAQPFFKCLSLCWCPQPVCSMGSHLKCTHSAAWIVISLPSNNSSQQGFVPIKWKMCRTWLFECKSLHTLIFGTVNRFSKGQWQACFS